MFGTGFPDDWSALKRLIWLRLKAGGGEQSEILSVTGISPLVLANAVAKNIHSLTQTGKCAQASTPTPTSPVDIKCNNGALRMVDDELPSRYKRVLGFNCNNNAMWQIADFHLRGSDTVKVSFSVTAACNVWGCYQSTSATDNYDLYATTTSGGKYFRYGNGTYASYFSTENQGKRFDVIYTPTGSIGMPEDSTWTEMSFESANDLLLGSTTITGTSSKLRGKLYGDFIVLNGNIERLHLVPCERVSDNVLGYYDLVGETFYEPYEGFDGAVSLGYDGSHYVLQTVGTPEVITVTHADSTTETASAVDLFAVGDYADTEELIVGIKMGKVGVYVCTGGETVTSTTDGQGNTRFVVTIPDALYVSGRTACLCTHYVYASSGNVVNSIFLNNGKAVITAGGYTTEQIADFKADVAAEYAAGHPVIILYPLATETTEQTTPHSLSTTEGTNTISVTAEVSAIPLACEYWGIGA